MPAGCMPSRKVGTAAPRAGHGFENGGHDGSPALVSVHADHFRRAIPAGMLSRIIAEHAH